MPIQSIEQLERFLEMPHEFASFHREPDRDPRLLLRHIIDVRYGLKSIIDAARVVSEKTGVSIAEYMSFNVHDQWDLIRYAFSERAERLTDTTDTGWISKANAFRLYGEKFGIGKAAFYDLKWSQTRRVGREVHIPLDELKREAEKRVRLRRRFKKRIKKGDSDR